MVSLNDLNKILLQDSKCNFIALAITYLHANSIDATVKYLEEKGIVVKGYVLISSHHTTGKILDESKFLCQNNPNIKFLDFDYSSVECFSTLQKIKNKSTILFDSNKYSNNNIYVAWMDIDWFWVDFLKKVTTKKVTYILLDDGGGSYANKWQDFLHWIQYENQGKISSLKLKIKKIKGYLNCIFRDIIIKQLKKRKRLIIATIFSKQENKNLIELKPNKEFVIHYVNTFKEIGRKLEKDSIDIMCGSAIFNTQCLVENNITDGILDYDVYKCCFNILKKYDITTVIKPHPRELNNLRYQSICDYIYERNDYSQEVLLANLSEKPKCIISIFSSTLLNAYGLFDICTISLAKIVKKNNISKEFEQQLNEFIELYKDLFLFPETMEEFENIVKSIK